MTGSTETTLDASASPKFALTTDSSSGAIAAAAAVAPRSDGGARRDEPRRDHSAVTDATKLAESDFSAKKATIIYGFDYPNQSIDPLTDAFETLASRRVELGPRYEFGLTP